MQKIWEQIYFREVILNKDYQKPKMKKIIKHLNWQKFNNNKRRKKNKKRIKFDYYFLIIYIDNLLIKNGNSVKNK